MRYLSVCSGIEAATVAWHHLGWTPVGFSEIEPFPSAVLAHHYPNVPNYGDMTKHQEWPIEPGTVDLLVGGTPCQSFSVAGLRKGLSDPRGGLMLTYLEIARRLRPRWIVWENVPGVLSSNGGRDFGSFLGALGQLGYGWAYRVLDAQWVRTQRHPRAVPQRRRRVFVVACLGDWERAAQVLFERESVQRDSATRRAKGQGAAADAEAGARAGCYWDGSDIANTLTRKGCDDRMPDKERLFAVLQPVASTLGNRGLRSHTELDGHGAYITQPVPCDLFQITAPVNRQNRQPGDPCHTLARDNAAHAAVAFTTEQTPKFRDECALTLTRQSPTGGGQPQAVACPTLTAHNDPSRSPQSSEVTQQVAAVHAASMTVRRLTPRECERLQGFPDDYTLIPWRGKSADQCPDGPRYKALGNSMAVNCMAWIGERIHALNCEHDQ
jgi:DNA (cytosine-5)-methyltransferase 1